MAYHGHATSLFPLSSAGRSERGGGSRGKNRGHAHAAGQRTAQSRSHAVRNQSLRPSPARIFYGEGLRPKGGEGRDVRLKITRDGTNQCPSRTRFLLTAGISTTISLVPFGTHWHPRRDCN